MLQICNGYLVYVYLKVFRRPDPASVCLMYIYIIYIYCCLRSPSAGILNNDDFMLFQHLQNDTWIQNTSSLSAWYSFRLRNSAIVCVINERKSLVKWRKFLVELGLKLNMTSWPSLSLYFQAFLALVDAGSVFVPVSWHWHGNVTWLEGNETWQTLTWKNTTCIMRWYSKFQYLMGWRWAANAVDT